MDHLQCSKQRERRQRGEDFQDEISRSWSQVPNTWRMTIPDGGGETRPADQIILTEHVNILAELKRTEEDRFKLSMLRPSQLKGLQDFDRVIARNKGLVFVSFYNEAKNIDQAYIFRLTAALEYMKDIGRQYITSGELFHQEIDRIRLMPEEINNQRGWDLRGVPNQCRLL